MQRINCVSNCVFCNIEADRIVDEYNHFVAIRDLYPVTPLHTLVIPKRHIVTYFQCNENEHQEIPAILNSQKNKLIDSDREITGFNIGMNIGEDAGQTVFHFHIHIIPRRTGDTENPRGGIRGVIPHRQNYH